MEVLILNEHYVDVKYDTDFQIVSVIWLSPPDSKQYRYVYSSVMEQSRHKNISLFLSDIRKQGVVSPEERKWFEMVVVPTAIEAGLQKAAVVFDGNIFKKYYLNTISSVTKKMGLPFQFFLNSDEAFTWLIR